MRARWRAAVPALMLTAGLAGSAAAQGARVAFSGSTGSYRTLTRESSGVVTRTGTGVGGEAFASLGRLHLRAGYAEATVSDRTLVEGTAMMGASVLPWLTIWAGPHARAYETTAGAERWLLWEVRAGVQHSLILDLVSWSLEAWSVADAQVDIPERFDEGFGAEGGLGLQLLRSRVWGGLAYRVEQVRMQGVRRETNEVLSLWVRLGRGP